MGVSFSFSTPPSVQPPSRPSPAASRRRYHRQAHPPYIPRQRPNHWRSDPPIFCRSASKVLPCWSAVFARCTAGESVAVSRASCASRTASWTFSLKVACSSWAFFLYAYGLSRCTRFTAFVAASPSYVKRQRELWRFVSLVPRLPLSRTRNYLMTFAPAES